MFPTWTSNDGEVGNIRLRGERWAAALDVKCDRPAWTTDGEARSPRPLRLFAAPEPIEALAEVPDGPPLRFLWRRVTHHVAHAEGPERIALEWWRPGAAPLTRDYFRVEDSAGARFWIFRDGLYGREALNPRWYLHGLFA